MRLEIISEGGATKFSQYQLPGGENYREVLVTMPIGKETLENANGEVILEKSRGSVNEVFTSSHFSDPNILYHLRLNDRTTADGKKMLFAEEIQSDWHQKGRKRGMLARPEPKND